MGVITPTGCAVGLHMERRDIYYCDGRRELWKGEERKSKADRFEFPIFCLVLNVIDL